MKIAFFSCHSYDIEFMKDMANKLNITPEHELAFYTNTLSKETATLAKGCEGVVIFVNDNANGEALRVLHEGGTRVLFLRCAGFDMVDLEVAKELKMPVLRVPAYSPYAVAEHAAALLMTLNRKIHRSFNRTRELNFRLAGLMGFDLNGKTVGVIGTGKIGALFIRICKGFGCRVIAYDVRESEEAKLYGAEYVPLEEIWKQSHVISLHCPLLPSTKHIINTDSIHAMQPGVVLINTSRGGLIDTAALVRGIKSKIIGAVGLDVIEGENDYFYSDCSGGLIADDALARLFTFQNVIITGHQAFFTKEAVENIARTTMENIEAYATKSELKNEVK
jgi:D-lactate dehydrogenase